MTDHQELPEDLIKSAIVVNLKVEGFHMWPEAEDYSKEVSFLAERHRHVFYIKIMKMVEHNDRDVEIILFKREVSSFLKKKYGEPCEFGRMSCEDIAEELLKTFHAFQVEVLEDDENGGVAFLV